MNDFLTSRAECYLIQRINDLHNQQTLFIGDLRNLHYNGKSYADSPSVIRLLDVNAAIKVLFTQCTLLAEINDRAREWGAIAPERVEPAGRCGAEDMVAFEEIPF